MPNVPPSSFPSPSSLVDVITHIDPEYLCAATVADYCARTLIKIDMLPPVVSAVLEKLETTATELAKSRSTRATGIASAVEYAIHGLRLKTGGREHSPKATGRSLVEALPVAPDGAAPVLVLDPGNHPEMRRR